MKRYIFFDTGCFSIGGDWKQLYEFLGLLRDLDLVGKGFSENPLSQGSLSHYPEE
jgi:hypothetical protein